MTAADLGDRAAAAFGRPDDLSFAAPVHVRVHPRRAGDTLAVSGVDDVLAALGVAGDLRYGAGGRERLEWSEALDRAADAKFARTPDRVEAARRAFRAYAAVVGILVPIQACRPGGEIG